MNLLNTGSTTCMSVSIKEATLAEIEEIHKVCLAAWKVL